MYIQYSTSRHTCVYTKQSPQTNIKINGPRHESGACSTGLAALALCGSCRAPGAEKMLLIWGNQRIPAGKLRVYSSALAEHGGKWQFSCEKTMTKNHVPNTQKWHIYGKEMAK